MKKILTIIISILMFAAFSSAQEHEWFPDNSPTGAEPTYTSLKGMSGKEIEARLLAKGGMYITGRTKSVTWKNQDGSGKTAFYKECVYWNKKEKAFVHGWRGRGDDMTTIIYDRREVIRGDPPKIKGEFYQEN